MAQAKKSTIFVNYIRRSDVGVLELKKKIDNKVHLPLHGHVWYSKGMFNSASHFINLFQFFFGDLLNYKLLNKKQYPNNDLNLDFQLNFDKAEIIFQTVDAKNFFHNTFELIAKNCRVRYDFGGAEININYKSTNKVLTNYHTLGEDNEQLESDFYNVQWHVVNEISKFMKDEKANVSFIQDAIETLKVLNGLRKLI